MRFLGLGVLAAGLVAISALPAAAYLDTNNRTDRVVGSGSDTTYEMLLDLGNIYNSSFGCETIALAGHTQPLTATCAEPDTVNTITTENYDHDVVSQLFPIGSSAGLNQLCAQGNKTAKPYRINFARSSRAPRNTDCGGLRFVAYARDAIPWIHFTGAGSQSTAVTNLTQQQVKDIFVNCTITNWNQVGGADAPIIVYAATKASGTAPTFDGFIAGNAFNCIPAQYKDGDPSNGERVIRENDVTPIMTDGNEENAIFYSSYGRFVQNTPTDWAMGSVGGVAPNATTIADASFPYGRFIYNVYRAATAKLPATDATLDFLAELNGWLCSPSSAHSTDPISGLNYRALIEAGIEENGFVPLQVGAVGGGVAGTSHCRALTLTP
jgi:phosphate transport system substrate-binding protein